MKKENVKDSEKNPGAANTVQRSVAFSNDMDESFFHYLADLKKIEIPSHADKDDMIWQTDHAMNILQECIFTFAPAVENFCQILGELANDSKLSKDDIFFTSSLKNLPQTPDKDFFFALKQNIENHLSELRKSYDSPESTKIRCDLLKVCCTLKINYDYIDIFFNRICDYLTLWSEKDSIKIRNHKNLINSYTAEQRKFLSEKLLIPESILINSLQKFFEASQKLTELKHAILSDHLRLVISIAQKFRNRGVPFNDIVQEGNLGLMRAIDKFDPHLGHKFSTYAVWWIKQNIIHGIAEQSRTIRIPAHMLKLINKINLTEQHLLQTLGREPESDEIAEVLELSVAKVNAVRCMARQAISLQTPVGTQDGNFSLEDTLKDETGSAGDFTDFDKDVTYQMLYKLLKTLNNREQEIIILRFGLFGNKPTPFTELSERFNLTRERVRQLELKILNKLRAPDKLKLLDYNFSPPKKQG